MQRRHGIAAETAILKFRHMPNFRPADVALQHLVPPSLVLPARPDPWSGRRVFGPYVSQT